MNKTYTVKQVADLLGYSTNSIYTFLKEGRIKGVRIGKGRFRVSQEELDKLLHLKKSQEAQPVSVGQVDTLSTPSQSTETVLESEEIPSLDKHLEELKGNIPSLFDWFVSLASIIIGFSMILFVQDFEGFSDIGLLQFLTPIKINLLAAGIGLFSVNVLNRARKKWHFIFDLIILLNLSIFSLMLFLSKDLLGFVIFALLSSTMFFHLILNLKGIVSFAFFISFLTIFLPITLIIFPSAINIAGLGFISTWPPVQTAFVWLLASGAINGSIWLWQNKQKPLFWISILVFNAGLVYFAYLYVAQLYWSRALIFILMFLSVVMSSFWHKLNFKDEETRKTVVSIFIDLLLIFLAIIMVIWVVQNNIRGYTQNESINKLSYGGNLVESTIGSSKEKLITLSRDKSLIEAVKKKDPAYLKKSIKDFFIYSLDFRLVWMSDDKGEILNVYPETGNVFYENTAFREYFRVIKTSKKSRISNLTEVQISGEKKEVMAIATPVLDEDGSVISILIASFDIDSLNNKLQQFANFYDKEYFLVLDGQGKVIIKPEGISVLSDEEIQRLLIDQTNYGYKVGQVRVANYINKLFQVNKQISETNWTLVLLRPLSNIYYFNNAVNLLLNVVIVSAGFIAIFWNMIHLRRRV